MVVEDLLQDTLPIVKGSPDCNAVDVFVWNCRHLSFLQWADSPFGIHDEDFDILLSPDSVDCGASGVAACSPEDIEFAAASFQDFFEEVSEELECDILECECWSVVEFCDEESAVSHWPDWDDLLRVEGCVAFVDEFLKLLVGECVPHEWLHHLECELRVCEFPPLVQFVRVVVRDHCWHQQSAVVCESHHDRRFEVHGLDAAACAYIE